MVVIVVPPLSSLTKKVASVNSFNRSVGVSSVALSRNHALRSAMSSRASSGVDVHVGMSLATSFISSSISFESTLKLNKIFYFFETNIFAPRKVYYQ